MALHQHNGMTHAMSELSKGLSVNIIIEDILGYRFKLEV
jgi:hypothetical protein